MILQVFFSLSDRTVFLEFASESAIQPLRGGSGIPERDGQVEEDAQCFLDGTLVGKNQAFIL